MGKFPANGTELFLQENFCRTWETANIVFRNFPYMNFTTKECTQSVTGLLIQSYIPASLKAPHKGAHSLELSILISGSRSNTVVSHILKLLKNDEKNCQSHTSVI